VIEPRIDPSADALVTTVIPTYRRPALLKRAIESVLGQTAGTQRIAVYDNASGDDTGAVVLDIARRDPRVRYHRQAANLGPFENFRFGLAEVSTPFFSLLSDDDVLLPRFYETALSALREHPTALFAVTRVLQVDRTGHLLSIEGRSWSPGLHGPPDSVREMLRLGYVTWTGTLFRREVIQRTGGFDSQTAAAFDLDFLLRLAARCPFVICDRVGGVYVAETSVVALEASLIAWEKIIDNISIEPRLSTSERAQAQQALRQQLAGLVYRIGRAAARQGKVPEARSAARVLRERFAETRRARLIEATAVVCRRVRVVPALLALLLQGYRDVRSSGLRGRLDAGDRRFLETMEPG